MAFAIGRADSTRILIPLNKCENLVAGVPNQNTGALISDALSKLKGILNTKNT